MRARTEGSSACLKTPLPAASATPQSGLRARRASIHSACSSGLPRAARSATPRWRRRRRSLPRRWRSCGVLAGDRIAVRTEKSVEAVVLYLACLRLGAVFVPINVAGTASEFEHLLRDSQPRLAILSPQDLETLRPVAGRAGVAHLETLGMAGRRVAGRTRPWRCAAAGARPARAAGAGGDRIHLRDHRAAQGRDADARQPCIQCDRAGACVAIHRRGCAAARAAAVPRARLVRGDQHRAGLRLGHPAAAEVRRRRRACVAAAGQRLHGCADALHAPVAGRAAQPRGDRAHASVRVRLGALARGDPPRVLAAHRAADPGALWHDRDAHEYLQSLRRPAAPRFRRAAPGGDLGAARPAARRGRRG